MKRISKTIPSKPAVLSRPVIPSAWVLGASTTTSLLLALPASGNGIHQNGSGARSKALGGVGSVLADEPLAALASNPAALTTVTQPAFSLGAVGLFADGEFRNAANPGGSDLERHFGVAPEMAVASPLSSKVTLGLGVTPEALLRAEWTYDDTNPGGATGVSYGTQKHESEIIVLRTALGLGVQVTPELSVGASVGLLYNDNALTAPYIFQSHPALAGLKTLLDLDADGFGWDAHVGALWRPSDNWTFGLTWKSPSVVHAEGKATGDVGLQLGAPSVPFRYDAEVENNFPQSLTLGAAWVPAERWRLLTQVDWINWSDAFDVLRVRLRNGSSAAINGTLGSTSLDDDAPLDWKDRFVFRNGLEFAATEQLTLRAGYAYGASPVPDGTLTPMTAVVQEHTVTLGAGWRQGRWQWDAAWQWDLPVSRKVGSSALRSGEYDNSRVEAGVHTLALTGTVRF